MEVVAPVRFTLCIVRKGSLIGVQNPVILRGVQQRLLGNSSLDAVRSRAIFDELTCIDFGC